MYSITGCSATSPAAPSPPPLLTVDCVMINATTVLAISTEIPVRCCIPTGAVPTQRPFNCFLIASRRESNESGLVGRGRRLMGEIPTNPKSGGESQTNPERGGGISETNEVGGGGRRRESNEPGAQEGGSSVQ